MEQASYISFDNGVCRRTHEQDPAKQRQELLDACTTVQLGGRLLDKHYKPLARCSAMSKGGMFVCELG